MMVMIMLSVFTELHRKPVIACEAVQTKSAGVTLLLLRQHPCTCFACLWNVTSHQLYHANETSSQMNRTRCKDDTWTHSQALTIWWANQGKGWPSDNKRHTQIVSKTIWNWPFSWKPCSPGLQPRMQPHLQCIIHNGSLIINNVSLSLITGQLLINWVSVYYPQYINHYPQWITRYQ